MIFKRYKLNYSEAEIGRMKGISRQAVHKTHVEHYQK